MKLNDEIKNLKSLQEDHEKLNEKFQSIEKQNLVLEKKIQSLELVRKKLLKDLEGKNLMSSVKEVLRNPALATKVSSPREILVKDLLRVPSSRNVPNSFGKKWSLASRHEVEKKSAHQYSEFLGTINRLLNAFKYPDKIVWLKNKLYSQNIWKTKISDSDLPELFISFICRISALINT